MNKEYIEAIKYYFNERLKSQLKDKFSKCESCSQKKQFINKPGKLIYSCGSKQKMWSSTIITLLAIFILSCLNLKQLEY